MPSAVARPAPSTSTASPLSPRRPSISLLSRNIDAVVLGNVQFDTWYYSPYPDSIILSLEPPTTNIRNGQLDGGPVSASSPSATSTASTTCPVLHICPYCFRYTPHLPAYVVHLRHHQQEQMQDPDLPPVPESATPVYSYGGYCVWEIDGETEKLYCQNLSLFGKLFLEQKSVFFDTGGFLYYVLTYTPPNSASLTGSPKKPSRRPSYIQDDLGLNTHVLGFFSKENPSWDRNNLACILIFPPYQHRQLGKLLMSMSYKLSGWEWEGGVIGGPEKPLSVMGRRSYLRFWSERVARFMLGVSADADGRKLFGQEKRKRRKNAVTKETLTVKDIGERTGMLAEDVVAALTEMGVCEPPAVKKSRAKKIGAADGSGRAAAGLRGDWTEEEAATVTVPRSRVMEWVQSHGVELDDPVREEGFLGEWAMSEADGDDVEMDEEQESD